MMLIFFFLFFDGLMFGFILGLIFSFMLYSSRFVVLLISLDECVDGCKGSDVGC